VSPEEIRSAVLRLLQTIAPEADVSRLRGTENLREELDLDSMDFLNFLTAVSEELQVAIPEADAAKLATLDGCVAYVRQHAA
jgi:acyl carrier protein